MLQKTTRKIIENGLLGLDAVQARFYGENRASYRDIPGPKPVFPVGNLSTFLNHPFEPWGLTQAINKEYGPHALVWLFNQPIFMLHDPAGMREVLETKMDLFYKDEPIKALKPASMFDPEMMRNGASWARKRRGSFFSSELFPTWLGECFEPGVSYLRSRLPTLAPRETSRFEDRIFRFVFDYLSFLLFGEEMGDLAFRCFDLLFTRTNWRLVTYLPLITPDYYPLKHGWYRSVRRTFEKRKSRLAGHELMGRVISLGNLPEEKMAYDLANVYAGGMFSITTVLCHLLADLTNHPEALSSARAAARGMAGTLDYTDLEASRELEAPLRESMRVRAPVPLLIRRVKARELSLGDFRLTRDTRVFLGISPLHLDEAHWPEAEHFNPSRWTDEVLRANPYGSDHFLPFGRGPRYCIGGDLALFVLRTTLFALLSSPSLGFRVADPTKHVYKIGCMFPKRQPGFLGRADR